MDKVEIEQGLKRLEFFKTNLSNFSKLDCKGVHNFSFSTLDAYFYFNEMMAHSKKPLLLLDSILFLPNKQGKYKSFVYSEPAEQKELFSLLRKLGPVYSIDKVAVLESPGKFVEVAYDLAKVNDPASYPNAKKRHQKLTYPLKQLEKMNVVVEEISKENWNQVNKLHDKWVEFKMNDPKTFKMMFPNKRYIYCCQKALMNKVKYRSYVFKINEEVIATRILGIQGNMAFDLANFGNTWDSFSQMMNYADTYVLKNLYENGFETLNCGAGLNKTLKAFKEHYPSFEIVSYAYSQTK